jgi:hypothetical protein
VAIDRFHVDVSVGGGEQKVNGEQEVDAPEANAESRLNPSESERGSTVAGALVIQLAFTGARASKVSPELFTLRDLSTESATVTATGERLGLWAAKTVVDMHGGNVRAYLSEGSANTSASTIFVVELPMSQDVNLNVSGKSFTNSSRPLLEGHPHRYHRNADAMDVSQSDVLGIATGVHHNNLYADKFNPQPDFSDAHSHSQSHLAGAGVAAGAPRAMMARLDQSESASEPICYSVPGALSVSDDVMSESPSDFNIQSHRSVTGLHFKPLKQGKPA